MANSTASNPKTLLKPDIAVSQRIRNAADRHLSGACLLASTYRSP